MKRSGACTVALPIWHADIEEFLSMQTEHGDQRKKCFDIFPQVVMYDLFLEACEKDDYWHCFDPYECIKVLGIDLNKYSSKYTWIRNYLDCVKAYKENKLVIVKKYKAKYLIKELIKTIVETGLPYIAYVDTLNKYNPNKHKGDIIAVNLCTAPETLVLTDVGYIEIQELENEIVNVWNGFEWSQTQVLKTGENQKLIKINFSNGEALDVTEYHKFYISTNYRGDHIEVRAKDLKPGDKIIKHKFPVIEGSEEFKYAYTHGFFCGDGSVRPQDGHGHIDLHPTKYICEDYIVNRNKLLGGQNHHYDTGIPAIYEHNCIVRIMLPLDIDTKFIVPTAKHTIKSRLEWFAGILDSDGTVAVNGTNKQLQIQSIHKEFLKQIRYMLNTLGVDAKVIKSQDARQTLLPDGKGGNKYYTCKTGYRLLVTSAATFKLLQLGLVCHRLEIDDMEEPQRSASQFIKVVSIEDEGRISDTFCFTEPKRHWGIFNGILTGQCTESLSNVDDDNWHTCSLSSLNLANIENHELEKYCRLITRILDNILNICEYPIEESENHVKNYRTIGIGILGLADYFAKHEHTYETAYSSKYLTYLFEDIAYYCTSESIQLAKERGAYNYFEKSEWANGNRIMNFKINSELPERWDNLQNEINTYGIRNSQLTSPAPNTTSGLIQGVVAGILPPFNLLHYDDSSNGAIAVMPPFINKYPLRYKAYSNYDMLTFIDYVAEMQKWIDTSISFESLMDLTKTDENGKHVITAKYIYDYIIKSWKSGIKANYYWRFIAKDNKLTEKEECISCSG
jgi:ribonucleoside-diphosphate reductase alpha chain